MRGKYSPTTKYSTVVLWFKGKDTTTQMTLHNTTLGQAWDKAEMIGWKRPVWYKPWRYLQLHGHVTMMDRDLSIN